MILRDKEVAILIGPTLTRARTSTDLWNRLIVSVKPVHNRLTFYIYVVGRRCPFQTEITPNIAHKVHKVSRYRVANTTIHVRSLYSTQSVHKLSRYSVGNTTIHVRSLYSTQYEISCEICISTMAAPLWRLICQTKSDCIQAVAQELVKIWIFYIYMDRYFHIKVFIFVLGSRDDISGSQTTKLQIFTVRKYSIFVTVNE